MLLVAVPVGAVLWHTPWATGQRRMDEEELAPYVGALRAHGEPPLDHVVGRFASKDVVILGEAHRVRQDVLFVQDLIPRVYREAGVRRLLIEFGVGRSQEEADRVVRGVSFDRTAAKKLLFDYDEALWLYEEYLGLYEAAWRFNRTLGPDEEPFRILLANPGREDLGRKDALMAERVLEEVGRGEKVLVFCGSHHGFTRYRQPIPFESLLRPRPDKGRMGNRIHEALGDRVAFLRLHGPVFKRWGPFAPMVYRKCMLFPFGGVIDRAQVELGTPIAFETSLSPFASLEDRTSYYSLHRDGLTLSGFADGYVILAPLAERARVRPIDDLDEDDARCLRAKDPDEPAFESLASLRQLLETDGLMPERAYDLIDRSGYDRPSYALPISLFWPAVAVGASIWIALRLWRRSRAHPPGS